MAPQHRHDGCHAAAYMGGSVPTVLAQDSFSEFNVPVYPSGWRVLFQCNCWLRVPWPRAQHAALAEVFRGDTSVGPVLHKPRLGNAHIPGSTQVPLIPVVVESPRISTGTPTAPKHKGCREVGSLSFGFETPMQTMKTPVLLLPKESLEVSIYSLERSALKKGLEERWDDLMVDWCMDGSPTRAVLGGAVLAKAFKALQVRFVPEEVIPVESWKMYHRKMRTACDAPKYVQCEGCEARFPRRGPDANQAHKIRKISKACWMCTNCQESAAKYNQTK